MLHPAREWSAWTLVLNRYLTATTFLYFSEKLRSMGYRVLARGILHIYTQRQTVVASRRATVQSFPRRGMRRKRAGADFAIKSGFLRGIYTGFWCLPSRIFHSFANIKRFVFISLSFRAESRGRYRNRVSHSCDCIAIRKLKIVLPNISRVIAGNAAKSE